MRLLINIETNLIITISVIFVLLILGFMIWMKKRSKPKHKAADVSLIMEALGTNNIKSVEFLRQKIVIKVKQYKSVNLDQLKESGAIGINVIGNTIKFYYDKDNEQIVEAIKERVD